MRQRLLFTMALGCALARAGEVTLEQAAGEAMAKNLALAAERWKIQLAEAQEITARLRPNPVLTVSGQTLNVFGADYSAASSLGPNQVNVHTDVPIERGGKREARVGVAREDHKLAELGVRETMRQVVAAVQAAYVDVQQWKANVALAEDSQKRLEELVRINEARLKSGDLAQVELDRSRVAVSQSKAAAQQARLQLEEARVRLQRLMGRKELEEGFDVAGEPRRDAALPDLEEARRLALERRPDYLGQQEARARAKADLRLQVANGKQDLTLGSEWTHQTAGGFSGSSLGLYASMPLGVFNRNQGEIARATREIGHAGAAAEALEWQIRGEVESAWRQSKVALEMVQTSEAEMLKRARSVRDTTEYSYRRGEASLVEFLDAQRAFNEAMQTYNDARANYARSLYLMDTVSAATVRGE